MAVGMLHGFGYGGDRYADEKLAGLMVLGKTHLFDVRWLPCSRWQPSMSGLALWKQYRGKYHWLGSWLGNLNYKKREDGFLLPDCHRDAICWLADWLQSGNHAILLCACKDASACHRSLVVRLILEQMEAQACRSVPSVA